jgi:hypothetical protein
MGRFVGEFPFGRKPFLMALLVYPPLLQRGICFVVLATFAGDKTFLKSMLRRSNSL